MFDSICESTIEEELIERRMKRYRAMSRNTQTTRQPATKFARLQKKLQKQQLQARQSQQARRQQTRQTQRTAGHTK